MSGLRTENMRILPSLDHTIANNHTPIHLRDILPQNILVDSPTFQILFINSSKSIFRASRLLCIAGSQSLFHNLTIVFGKLFSGIIWFFFTSTKVMKATKLWSGKACAFITLHGTEEYVLVTFCTVWFALL